VKYLILGAFATGVLVYGIAWIYGATGSMSFDGIAKALANPATSKSAALLGAALLLCGLGFKVAAAPFPHVGAGCLSRRADPGDRLPFRRVQSRRLRRPHPRSRCLPRRRFHHRHLRSVLLLVAGSLTVLLGSLPAMFQTSVKRLLAYSSISHAGYLLLALACRESPRFDISSGGDRRLLPRHLPAR
jgi:NADH-quinone oxidoreductase subunit N